MNAPAATTVDSVTTSMISMPWAGVKLQGSYDPALLQVLWPFAWHGEDRVDEGPRTIATIYFEDLDQCARRPEIERRPHMPILLHQKQNGSHIRIGAEHIVVNHACGVHYHVKDGDPPAVTYCAPNGQPGIDALQVIRGLLVGAGLQTGRLAPLHGAVLRMGQGHGVLLAGAKGAGKTSFALGLLSRIGHDGGALVSNDKALLDTEAGRAYGLPYAIAIGDGSLAQLPSLAVLPRRKEGGKSLFWPADVASALGFGLRPSVILKEQWWCSLDANGPGVRMRPISPLRSRQASLGQFTFTLLPVWLLRLLSGWVPARSVRSIKVPAYKVEGNPWQSWPAHPDHELW